MRTAHQQNRNFVTGRQPFLLAARSDGITRTPFKRSLHPLIALVAAAAISALNPVATAFAEPIPVRSESVSLDDVDAAPYSWTGPCKVTLYETQGFALCKTYLNIHQAGKSNINTWIEWRFRHTGTELPNFIYLTGACRPGDGRLITYGNAALAPLGGSTIPESIMSSRSSYISVKFVPAPDNVDKSVLERVARDLIRKFDAYALPCGSENSPASANAAPARSPQVTPNPSPATGTEEDQETIAAVSAGAGQGDHLSTLGQCWSNEDHPSCQEQITEPTAATQQTAQRLFDRGAAAFSSNNFTEAAPDLLAAAEGGQVTAMGYVGHMYENGLAFEKDMGEAFRWYRRGAEGGDTFSANNVGRFYRSGWGVERNMPEAIRWFQQALEQGDSIAPYNLAYLYLNGRDPLPKDFDKAMELYMLSAERGYIKAYREVGWLNQNGWGAPADEAEALRWYRKAADLGDLAAMNDLGVYLQEGRGGLDPDPEAALQWFTRAAEGGLDQAMFNLARAYELGLGTQPDNERAAHWYREASVRGHEGARTRLDAL